MEPTIRRVTLQDAPMLASIARITFFDTFTGTCSEADMDRFLEDYFNLTQVQTELSNPADHFYFIEVNGQPAGYIRFMEDYSHFEKMKQWKALELKRIYVLKEFHGKGIAPLLLQHCEQYAKANHYEVVWLGVWEHNLRAQQFYKKNGFEDSGYTHDFPIGDTPQTDHWFWKFL